MKAGRLWKRSPVTKAYRSRLWYFATSFFRLCYSRGQRSGSPLLAEMNGASVGSKAGARVSACSFLAGFYFRAGREVKAIREDCPPGKEERKKVLSSISTSFPKRWKSRPAQRITGANAPFVSPTKKSSLTIAHSFPAEPPLFAIRSTTSAFPFYNIPRRPPFQSLRKNQYQSNQSPASVGYGSKAYTRVSAFPFLASSLIFPAQGSLLEPFPSLPHCSRLCATPYEDLLPFCPLSVHTVLKAEEEGWAAGTTSPLSHTSIQKQV